MATDPIDPADGINTMQGHDTVPGCVRQLDAAV
jgi:hypothetical protein